MERMIVYIDVNAIVAEVSLCKPVWRFKVNLVLMRFLCALHTCLGNMQIQAPDQEMRESPK